MKTHLFIFALLAAPLAQAGGQNPVGCEKARRTGLPAGAEFRHPLQTQRHEIRCAQIGKIVRTRWF